MNVTAIILARSGSKGLPNKNISLLNGISLLERGISYLQKTRFVNQIIVSSDSDSYLQEAIKLGALVHFRDPVLASDSATSISVLQAISCNLRDQGSLPDFFAYIQLTEPFRPQNILDECVERLIKNKSYDCAFAAFETHKNYWSSPSDSPSLLTPISTSEVPRQSKSPIYREDTGISLVVRPDVWIEGNRIGKHPCIVPYSTFHSVVDIHTLDDLRFAEHLEHFVNE